MPVRRLLAVAGLLAACGPIQHVPTEPRLLLAGGRASAGAEGAARAGGERLRGAAYGDTRGDRYVHRAAVAEMGAGHPGLIIFTGAALGGSAAGCCCFGGAGASLGLETGLGTVVDCRSMLAHVF